MGFTKVTLRREIVRIFLSHPHDSFITASEIAEMTGARPQLIGGALRRLKEDGFLEPCYYRTSGGCLWKRSDKKLNHKCAMLVNSCLTELEEVTENDEP